MSPLDERTRYVDILLPPIEETVVPMGTVLKMVGDLCGGCQEKVRRYLAGHQYNIRKPLEEQISTIIQTVEEETGVDIARMRRKENTRHVVEARRRVAIMARKYGISYPRIGAALGKHHTTIINLVNPKVRHASNQKA